jgi:hypothetical protein
MGTADIPQGRELRRRLWRLPRETRWRLWKMANRGDTAGDPRETALLAAIARRELRSQRWWLPLLLLVTVFNVFVVVFHVFSEQPSLLDILVTLLLLGFLVWELRRRPRLREAERKNREIALAEGGPG